MKNITKRDILFFILGFVFFLAIDIITNWESTKENFLKGYQDGYNASQKK